MSSSDSIFTTGESEFFFGLPTGRPGGLPTGLLVVVTYNINNAQIFDANQI